MSKAKVERTPLEKLQSLVTIAKAKGNVDATEYHHGMANGLILALAVMSGDDVPDFVSVEKFSLQDSDTLTLADAYSYGA